jgi:hypothetical protein
MPAAYDIVGHGAVLIYIYEIVDRLRVLGIYTPQAAKKRTFL